ncbi:MAG TPA: RNase adapter RapZ [Thiolinea sp.]|nr:RNase adapter RapZ [Thiolinea sp.]
MQIIIITGMSGAGKSYALQTLEDNGYYCIDNLPSQLIEALLQTPQIARQSSLAIGIDIRGGRESLQEIPRTIHRIRLTHPDTRLVYLYAQQDTLKKRYNESRRRHPLADEEVELERAIQLEETLLFGLAEAADWRIDTTQTNVYELGRLLKERLARPMVRECSILIQSFGFKHEAPSDSDMLFDVRCLPNPYWVPELRSLTGQDEAIVTWLENHPRVHELTQGIIRFLELWMQDMELCQRSYLNIAIGCTGGRHRSVYVAEYLYHHFRTRLSNPILLRHRELNYLI